MEFSSRNWSRKDLQKFWNKFGSIISIITEYSEYSAIAGSMYYVLRFWPQNVCFVTFVTFLWNFCKMILTQYIPYIRNIRNKTCFSNFAKIQKSEHSAFRRALVKNGSLMNTKRKKTKYLYEKIVTKIEIYFSEFKLIGLKVALLAVFA